MKTIDLFKVFSAEERMTREGGEKLRELILLHSKVKLQFHGKPIASVSFFDESIAKLAENGWDSRKIFESVLFADIHPRDLEIVNQLVKERTKTKKK